MSRKLVLAHLIAGCAIYGMGCSIQASPTEFEYMDPGLPQPSVLVTIMGDEEVVVNAEAHHCTGVDEWNEKMDVPDAPLRAFKAVESAAPTVVAAHYNNLAYITQDFGQLTRRDCNSMLVSNKIDKPEAFADREWLVSPYVMPDGTIYGLVHDEYWGGLHDATCKNRLGRRSPWESICLYVSIINAKSMDGGQSFVHFDNPPSIAAAFPYVFSSDMNRQGVRDPTNIIRSPIDDLYYFAAIVDSYGKQERGSCLFRTSNPLKMPWKAWDGSSFGAELGSPYMRNKDEAPVTCKPVSKLDFTTLVYSPEFRTFIAFGHEERIKPGGVYYRTSSDMIHWSAPITILEGHSFGFWKPGDRMLVYPSVLDPNSSSPSFDTVGRFAFLYYQKVRIRNDKIADGRMRDIVRMKISIRQNLHVDKSKSPS